jgi:hypothetical protein
MRAQFSPLHALIVPGLAALLALPALAQEPGCRSCGPLSSVPNDVRRNGNVVTILNPQHPLGATTFPIVTDHYRHMTHEITFAGYGICEKGAGEFRKMRFIEKTGPFPCWSELRILGKERNNAGKCA